MIDTNPSYSIRSKHANKVLDVCQDTDRKGMLIIYDNYKQPNQLFKFVNAGSGYHIVSAKSNKMLTVAANSSNNGVPIFEEPLPNLEGQVFRLKQSSNNEFFIETFCGKVLDCFEERKDNGTRVIQYDFSGNNNQKWILEAH